MTRRVAVALLGVCVAVAGCGSAGARESARQTSVLLVDCSGSTTPFRASWTPQVVEAASEALMRRDHLWIDCLDGSPLSDTSFALNVDGRQMPPQFEGNPTLEKRFLITRAAALRPQIEQLVESRDRARGSGLLDGLEVAAGLRPGVLDVWTDGLVIQDGIDLNAPLSAEASDAILRTWAPRLGALHGTRVTLIGLGYGAHDAASSRRARELLPNLLEAVGADVTTTPDLPTGGVGP